MVNDTFKLAREKGFIFPQARAWMDTKDSAVMQELAMDAALTSQQNATIPAELSAYIDPTVIEILTTPRNARKIFSEVKKGDWTTGYAKFRVQEYTGVTTPYSDFADGGVAGVNQNWPSREQYLFQTTIKYGDLESDMASVAKMNLASEKQKAAARVIDIDSNRFYLFGVAEKEIYGLLNDPNLNPSITPNQTSGGSTLWNDKDADSIYFDILKLASTLRERSGGNINEDSKFVMALSPSSSCHLAKINPYGLSVRQMLHNEFGQDMAFVELPELSNAMSGNTVMLMVKDIMGVPTAQYGFTEKYHAHPVVRELSSFKQKVTAGTYGCIIYYPFAIATMEGV